MWNRKMAQITIEIHKVISIMNAWNMFLATEQPQKQI